MLYLFSLLMISAFPLAALPMEDDTFTRKMEEAISRQEDEVKRTQAQATRHDVAPAWNTKLEFQNATIQLEVKKTLVNNFKNSESLASPLVRNKLMEVLNKPMVTTADLVDLQTTVQQEKARMATEKAQATPQKP